MLGSEATGGWAGRPGELPRQLGRGWSKPERISSQQMTAKMRPVLLRSVVEALNDVSVTDG